MKKYILKGFLKISLKKMLKLHRFFFTFFINTQKQ